jgi:type IV pilus assembly protein PilC
MSLFEYNSLTESGRLMRGSIEAADAKQARQMLEEMKLNVQELSKVQSKHSLKKFGANEFLLFNQQLESLTKAAIPLEKGLRTLAADAGSPQMRNLLNEIASNLEAGIPIEEAIDKRQAQFPPLYGMMLRAGIKTGHLSEMLTCLNRHLQIVQHTRLIITEAATYPFVVFLTASVIISGLFIFIIPTFAEVLGEMSAGRAGLPTITQMILTAAKYVPHFWVTLVILIITVILFWKSLTLSSSGRRAQERFIQAIPIFGKIHRNGILSRMSESMAMLVDSGCTLPESFRLAARASGSERAIHDSNLVAEQLEKGYPVLEAGAVCQMLPPLMLYSMQLGGQRNCLKENLQELGHMYAQQTFGMQARLQTILMPALIITLGVIIGTIVLAMFLPMVKIIQVLM